MSGKQKALCCTTQIIQFSGTDEHNSVQVISEDVRIVPSSGEHSSGSSKLKMKSIVDFNWEWKLYTGQLLAIHIAGQYIAYGISVGKESGLVRVVNRDNNEKTLLKDMKGMIEDIAFAHIPHEVILACVDEFGSLLVYKIEESDNIVSSLLLHIPRQGEISERVNHRVIWCPFIPDEEEISSTNSNYDDAAKLLVLTHGCKAELWSVGTIVQQYGSGPLFSEEVEEGFKLVYEHTQPIVDAAFSPDGVALATASLDGDIKFFQIYLHSKENPRCLHEWKPHDGKPVSSLFFLDNHQRYNPEIQFWKYAITGAENNTELKLWSCETWTCLQTLRFATEISKELVLKAVLDMGAGYLFLSDIYNKLLYILDIQKNDTQTSAYIQSVSEFPLDHPILSFGIVDAGVRTVLSSSLFEAALREDKEEHEASVQAVVMSMYLVQPKSLQECRLAFSPSPCWAGSPLLKIFSMSSDSLSFKDCFSDLSQYLLDKSDRDTLLQHMPSDHEEIINDTFSSPPRKESPTDVQSSEVALSHTSVIPETPTATLITTLDPCDDAVQLSPYAPADKCHLNTLPVEVAASRERCASGGSSPSREVQQIFSLKTSSTFLPDNIDEMEQANGLLSKTSPLKDEFIMSMRDEIDGDGWPQIPLTLVTDVCKSLASVDENSSKRSSAICPENPEVYLVQRLKQVLGDVTAAGERLAALVENQKEMAEALQDMQTSLTKLELQLKASSPEEIVSRFEAIIDRLQATMLTGLEEKLKDITPFLEEKNQAFMQDTINSLTQMVLNDVPTRLNEIVKDGFKSYLEPVVASTLIEIDKDIRTVMAQKLSENDLRNYLSTIFKSEAISRSYSNGMTDWINRLMRTSFKDVFSSDVLPCFEKTFQNMFQQINNLFTRITTEFLHTLDNFSYMNSVIQQQEAQQKIQTLQDTLKSSMNRLSVDLCEDLQINILAFFSSLEDCVAHTAGETVQDHLAKEFQAQKSLIEESVMNAVKSRTVAPHTLDTQLQQSQILQLIALGHFNAAFQLALSASDLNLVIFVCERVNPAQLFNLTPVPLQQNVLLSLIQQLSVDLANHTELKHKYLEEAVMALDPTNRVTREHMSSVIRNLLVQLMSYIENNPVNKLTRAMRMLHLAAKSLLIQAAREQ